MALLTLAAAAAAYSKSSLGPLQEAAKHSLGVSDHYIALLQGPALALPMVVAGLPLGFMADRYSRVRLLCTLSAASFAFTMLSALTASLAILFLARCLVGLAVFGTFPVAVSLIADLYEPAQRGRATMALTTGQFGGAAGVFVLGGRLLPTMDSWRETLLWLSAPLLIVALLLLAMREPPRRGVQAQTGLMRTALTDLWRRRGGFLALTGGVVIVEIALGAVLTWSAPTFSRSFGLNSAEIGGVMGIVILCSGVAGAVLGGAAVDLSQRSGGARRSLATLTALAVLSVPTGLFPMTVGVVPAAILLALFIALVGAICVMGTVLITIFMPSHLHGMATAVLSIAGAIFGIGVAPLTVSVLSQWMGGESQVGEALSAVCIGASLVAVAIFSAGLRLVPERNPVT